MYQMMYEQYNYFNYRCALCGRVFSRIEPRPSKVTLLAERHCCPSSTGCEIPVFDLVSVSTNLPDNAVLMSEEGQF